MYIPPGGRRIPFYSTLILNDCVNEMIMCYERDEVSFVVLDGMEYIPISLG